MSILPSGHSPAGRAKPSAGAWRNDAFSGGLESLSLDVFKDLLTSADHKARMDMRLYAEDANGLLRSANRAGGNAAVIAKARIAVFKKAANAKALLDAVPAEAQRDVGLIFSRVQLLRRADKAAELILSVPVSHGQAINSDEWWGERRLVARKLLDLDETKTAYRIARDAAIPSKDNYRAEHQFTAGWIALRFLNDPATALAHFAKVGQGNSNPITLARRLLAGTRGRSSRPEQRGARALRGGGTLFHRLLRPDRARAARPQGHRRASPARAPRTGATRKRGSRSRPRSSCSTPSTSET